MSTLRFSLVFTALVGASLFASACDETGLLGLSFDPVDEDYDRPRPKLAAGGEIRATCAAEPADDEEAFAAALCLCGDLDLVGSGMASRSESGLLGEDPGMGHIGINGRLGSVGELTVDGDLDLRSGFSAVGDVGVAGSLYTGDDVSMTGSVEVGGDAWIDGDLSVVGDAAIDGDLYLSGSLRGVGDLSYDQGHRGFDYGSAPCGCGDAQLIDVPSIVAAHATDNDNALLPEVVGEVALVLDTGSYYFADESELVGAASIEVIGDVSLYLEGDLSSVGALNITVADGGQLDIWTTGAIRAVGNIDIATEAVRTPRAFRLFMGGGEASIDTVGDARFLGAIYAPTVDISFVGSLEIEGALFANDLHGTGDLVLRYDTDTNAPEECVAPLM